MLTIAVKKTFVKPISFLLRFFLVPAGLMIGEPEDAAAPSPEPPAAEVGSGITARYPVRLRQGFRRRVCGAIA